MILHHIHNQNAHKNRNTDKLLFSSHLDFRQLMIDLIKVSYKDETPNSMVLVQNLIISESFSSEVLENLMTFFPKMDLYPHRKYRPFFQTYHNRVLVRHM